MSRRLERTSDAHDFPLDFHWRTDPSFISRAGVSLTGHRKAVMAISSIMTSVVLAAAAQAGGWVSYSRNTNFYAGLTRYEGTAFTYDRVLAAVEKLKGMGLIEEDRALPHPVGSGWQSRIRATDKLIYAFEGATFEPVINSVLRMKDGDNRLVDFSDTQATRRMANQVEARNEALRPIGITLPEGDGWEHRDAHVLARSEKAGGGWAMVRPKPYPYVIRSFSRNSWACHGRLYGWWQLLPAARRAEMLIDGEAVVEHDYSCLHGTLLYAKVGLKPNGDLYRVPGYEHLRNACKGALNTGFNSASFNETVWSLLGKEEKKPGSWPHSYAETVKIVKAVEAHNEPIRQFIGSDAGIGLMRIDSDMAIEVLKRCSKKGIAVLPVHDSFASKEGHGDTVRGIMDEVLDETCNAINPSKRTIIGQIPLQVGGPRMVGPLLVPAGDLPSPGVAVPAEPEVPLSLEAAGIPLPLLETPSPEAVSGLAGVETAPSPEAAFRPVLSVRIPSIRPSSTSVVVAPAPLPPAPLSPPAPAPAPIPLSSDPVPLPPFLVVIRDAMHAEAEAAAAAAAKAKEALPQPPPQRGRWAPLPARQKSPASRPVEPVVTVPAPRPARPALTGIETPSNAPIGSALASPPPRRPLTLQEAGAKARARLEARKREEARKTFR